MGRAQRGVALITVLIIVAVMVLVAAGMSGGTYLHLVRTANMLDSDQAQEYARGAEEFAIQILKKSFEKDGDERIHLRQMWAVQGMSFPIEGGVLTGEIRDLKSCFNLNSLLVVKANTPGQPPPSPDPTGKTLGQEVFASLMQQVGVVSERAPEGLAQALKDWIDTDQNPAGPDGAEDVHYLGEKVPYRTADQPLASVTELRVVKGFTPKVYDRLRPYVCVLPETDSIDLNVNTIPKNKPELLAMMFKDGKYTLEQARDFLQRRPEKGYSPAELQALPTAELRVPGSLKTNTEYFLLKARAVVGRGEARIESVIRKDGKDYRVLSRHFGEEDFEDPVRD